jgi:hypothetical protein
MPIHRTTPVDPPPRTDAFITRVEMLGLSPGQVPEIRIEVCGGIKTHDDPETWEYVDPYSFAVSGPDAVAFILANIQAYQSTKAALYQLLIDKGLEEGAIT